MAALAQMRPSPDGRWVTFDIDRAGDDQVVEFVMVPVGGGTAVTHMIHAPVSRILEMDFSPDGQKIALVIGLNNPRNGVDGLWIIDVTAANTEPTLLLPEGGVPSQVWVERDGKLAYIGYAGVSNFVWSQDSQTLYAMAGLADSCETSGTISFKLVPSPDG